jgi:hypothetical protein
VVPPAPYLCGLGAVIECSRFVQMFLLTTTLVKRLLEVCQVLNPHSLEVSVIRIIVFYCSIFITLYL